MKIILIVALVAIASFVTACQDSTGYETRQDWRKIHRPAPDTGS